MDRRLSNTPWQLIMIALSVASFSLGGCAPGSRMLRPQPARSEAFAALIADHPVPTENIRVSEIGRGENSSVSLIQIRDRELPHVHTRYDLSVVLVSGAGTLWLDGKALTMDRGDAAFIPRGTAHYFINDGSEPAIALVTFAPAFRGPDQELLPID